MNAFRPAAREFFNHPQGFLGPLRVSSHDRHKTARMPSGSCRRLSANVAGGIPLRQQPDVVRHSESCKVMARTFAFQAECLVVEHKPGHVFKDAQPFGGAVQIGIDETKGGG